MTTIWNATVSRIGGDAAGVCQEFRTVGVVSGGQATAGRVLGMVCSVHALAGVR